VNGEDFDVWILCKTMTSLHLVSGGRWGCQNTVHRR
jgi:hypothetical protein